MSMRIAMEIKPKSSIQYDVLGVKSNKFCSGGEKQQIATAIDYIGIDGIYSLSVFYDFSLYFGNRIRLHSNCLNSFYSRIHLKQ